MGLQGENTREAFQRALQVIPRGVNSNFRYWGEEDTLVAARAQGPYLWDLDGRRYIDYRLGFGPIILGHAYPPVVERVREALESGTITAWVTPAEIELAERLCRLCKVDRVRLSNSGTEATMHALRLARAYTGREKFIKFEGQYHGMTDYFLYTTASAPVNALGVRTSPVPVPSSSGIPAGIAEYVIVLPYNDVDLLERTVRARWGDIAAIFLEPVMGNIAGILPDPAFLQALRSLCDEYGIVLVFDEVKTGFRLALGGAQEHFGMKADLVTYAKALGNGFPVAAIAGREDIMETIGPGAAAHGGTYAGNAVAVAAALATLDVLEKEPVIESINRHGQMLMSGLREILSDAGIPHALTGLPPMFGYVLGTDKTPRDLREFHESDRALYEALAMALARRGVLPDADGREPWFLSYSHDETVVAETLNIFEDAVKEVKAEWL